ncbi:MAG: dephospho-CoA kinase [Candidatus Muirbacterium halophilum]|nr:dephospho-CoA kinase [Candidatus Muirbacterium halophilum]MCK9475415.1 dephospho-CoA kinase [Candidatus Muirbacterium halophilum]
MNSVIIGVTGKIGSGKTTLISMFEKADFFVINCDVFARTMIDNSHEILDKLKLKFGNIIFDKENKLDRKKLREIVFNNKKELQNLNSITHPFLFLELKKFLLYCKNIKQNIVFEAAVMFEAKLHKLADNVLWVESDLENILKRVSLRDNEKINTLKNIYKNQVNYQDYAQYIDFRIFNNSNIEDFKKDVNNIIKKLKI